MSNYPEGYRREPAGLSDEMRVRREKLFRLQDEGHDPYHITRFVRSHYSAQVTADYDALAGQDVSVAGRIMAKRVHGKAGFLDIQDDRGRIQLYVSVDDLGDALAEVKTWDVGDIVGATGFVFKTRTETVSVHVKKIELLSKSLRPLPEKFHGMTDMEQRYRRRYVDLIMNEDSRRVFEMRTKFIRIVRRVLDARGYYEVETPVLGTILGGANARPFITHHNTLDIDMYLRIATELNLKRLIVGGMERVYEIGRIFRNEGMDTKHNPEFTTVELYESYADYNVMMDIMEEILSTAAIELCGSYQLTWHGKTIDLTPPFARKSMAELVKEHLGIDFMANADDAWAVQAAKDAGVDMDGVDQTWGQALYECYDQKVEGSVVQPTFVMLHPVEVSPLAKRSPADPRLTERFELFIDGCEFSNAFSELNDPLDQRLRFERQAEMKAAGNDEATDMDVDFCEALEYGMPPTGGMGIGIDRSVMLLAGVDSIRDVILFPTMKPLDSDKKAEKAASASAEAAQAAPETPEKIDFSNVEIEPLFKDFVDFDTFAKSDYRAVKVKECEAVKKSKKLLKFVLDDGTGVDRVILSGIHEYYEPEELVGKTCIAITNLPPRAMMGIDSCGMLISAVHHENGEEKLHLLMVDPHIPAGAKLY